MKRSKMLDILQNFFESDCAFEDPHDARISADRVLSIIEKYGMSPPMCNHTVYYDYNGIPDAGSYNVNEKVWEEE